MLALDRAAIPQSGDSYLGALHQLLLQGQISRALGLAGEGLIPAQQILR